MRTLCVIAFLVLTLGLAPKAEADLILAGTIGTTDFCASDNDVGCTWGTPLPDLNPAIGILSLGPTTIEGLLVNGSLHIAFNGPPLNVLTSSSLDIVNQTTGTVSATVAVGATGFVGPVAEAFSSGSGTWVTAAGSTIDLEWWNDPANSQGAETPTDLPGTLIDSFSDTAVGPADAFSTFGGPFGVIDPGLFSMTLGFNLDLVGGGTLNSRGQAELKPVVPEPATITLLGLGLAGVAARARRRKS